MIFLPPPPEAKPGKCAAPTPISIAYEYFRTTQPGRYDAEDDRHKEAYLKHIRLSLAECGETDMARAEKVLEGVGLLDKSEVYSRHFNLALLEITAGMSAIDPREINSELVADLTTLSRVPTLPEMVETGFGDDLNEEDRLLLYELALVATHDLRPPVVLAPLTLLPDGTPLPFAINVSVEPLAA